MVSCAGSPSSQETPSPTTRPEEPLGWEFRGREGCQSEAPLLGCSTFSSHSDWCMWRWLQDTAATLGMTLPTPFTLEGKAGSKQLWGVGRRECQKQVMSTCMLPGTDIASSVCSQRLRTTRQVIAPSLKGQVLLDQTPHSILLVCIWSGLRTASHGTGGLERRALGTLTSTRPQPSSLQQFN